MAQPVLPIPIMRPLNNRSVKQMLQRPEVIRLQMLDKKMLDILSSNIPPNEKLRLYYKYFQTFMNVKDDLLVNGLRLKEPLKVPLKSKTEPKKETKGTAISIQTDDEQPPPRNGDNNDENNEGEEGPPVRDGDENNDNRNDGNNDVNDGENNNENPNIDRHDSDDDDQYVDIEDDDDENDVRLIQETPRRPSSVGDLSNDDEYEDPHDLTIVEPSPEDYTLSQEESTDIINTLVNSPIIPTLFSGELCSEQENNEKEKAYKRICAEQGNKLLKFLSLEQRNEPIADELLSYLFCLIAGLQKSDEEKDERLLNKLKRFPNVRRAMEKTSRLQHNISTASLEKLLSARQLDRYMTTTRNRTRSANSIELLPRPKSRAEALSQIRDASNIKQSVSDSDDENTSSLQTPGVLRKIKKHTNTPVPSIKFQKPRKVLLSSRRNESNSPVTSSMVLYEPGSSSSSNMTSNEPEQQPTSSNVTLPKPKKIRVQTALRSVPMKRKRNLKTLGSDENGGSPNQQTSTTKKRKKRTNNPPAGTPRVTRSQTNSKQNKNLQQNMEVDDTVINE